MSGRDQEREPHGSFLDHALLYAQAGLAVLPLRPKGKTPLPRHGVKDATTDPQRLRDSWRRWPAANLGVAVPERCLVLDLDTEDALQRLKAEDRPLPATARARTARGYHLWYRTPSPVRNRVAVLPGVDVRGLGGYVVVPPSVHPSGARYEWEEPLKRSTVAEAPAWLLSLLSEAPGSQGGATKRNWLQVITEPVPEGRRNQTLAEVCGFLFRHLRAEIAAELALCWARVRLQPPLPEAEILRTVNSIAGRELRRQEGRR